MSAVGFHQNLCQHILCCDSQPATDISAFPTSNLRFYYFRTLGIPILVGRNFDDSDNPHSEPVAIISLDMAERNWISPELAVGSQIAFGTKSRFRIIGVTANFGGYWYQKPVPTVYLPEAQSGNWSGEVILRTTASASSVAEFAPQVLAGMPIAATISDVSTMQERWQATLTRPLARMAGMLLLALLGLGLNVQGVYAVAAATLAGRGRELAVRSALGATPILLAWNVTRELLLAITLGTSIGVAVAVDVRPLLERWLGPIAVWQVGPIAVAVGLLTLATACGCYVPVLAAARANPIDVLRQG